MPRSTRRPDLDGTGSYGRLLGAFLDLSDTETMTHSAIQGMRRAYAANVAVIALVPVKDAPMTAANAAISSST